MAPLRTFSQRFGAVTDYDAATNTYSVSRNERNVYVTPYSSTAWINDRQVDLKSLQSLSMTPCTCHCALCATPSILYCTWGPSFQQVVIIDVSTHQQIIWARDDGWAGRPHRWEHPVNYRVHRQFQSPPRRSFHGGADRGFHSGPGHEGGRPTTVHSTILGGHNPRTVVHTLNVRTSGGHKQPPFVHTPNVLTTRQHNPKETTTQPTFRTHTAKHGQKSSSFVMGDTSSSQPRAFSGKYPSR